MIRRRSVVARIVGGGVMAAVVVIGAPAAVFGPPTWVPDALVPSFLDRRMGPTVALVPGDGWDDEGPTAATEAPIEVGEPIVALLAQPEDDDPWGKVVYASITAEPTVVVDQSIEPAEGVFPVATAQGLGGLMGVDDLSGHRWVTLDADGRHLTLWSGMDVTHETLAVLGEAIDPSQPLDRQKLPGDWRVATTTSAALSQGVERKLSQAVSNPDGFIEITTRTGVGPDAMWLVGSATVADRIEVRGRPGLITGLDTGGPITLTWTEEPGVTVQLTYVRDPSGRDIGSASGGSGMGDTDRSGDMLDALRVAYSLRPVDTETWRRFLDEADQHHVAERIDPGAPPVTVLDGQLADGRDFRVEERGHGRLCVVIDGPHPFDRCDVRPGTGRDGSTSALPRLVDPGDLLVEERSPLIAYGYLPERRLVGAWGQIQESLGEGVPTGQAVAVQVADIRGRAYGEATLVGGAWAMHISEIDLGLVVTYTFADGTTLEVEPDPGSEPDGDIDPASGANPPG